MFSYDAIAALPTIYAEIGNRDNMNSAINFSMTITAIFYCIIGVCGYIGLGNDLEYAPLITNRPYYWGNDYFMLIGKFIVGCTFLFITVMAVHLFRINCQRIFHTTNDNLA